MKAVVFVLYTVFAVGLADVLDPAICTSPGPVCTSCTELAMCILAEGDYNIIHLESCDAGKACRPEGCTTDLVDGCFEPLDFVCYSKGIFPEPFDCRKYHFCVSDKEEFTKYSATCASGYGYDPTTFSCSHKLEDNACPKERVVPVCQQRGQTGQLSNPSLFYVCHGYSESNGYLYPYLFACPNGEHYDGNYKCKAAKDIE